MWHTCGRGEVHNGICRGNLRERANLEDLNVNGMKIGSSRGGMGRHKLDCSGSGYGQVTDHVRDTCECGNELSGSIKCGEFLD